MHMLVPYSLLFLRKENKVLLIKRANVSFGNGLYSLIGGKVEVGETFTQALVREAFEEIGITIAIQDLEFVHAFYRDGKDKELVAFIFSADKWQGDPFNKEPEKHSELAWFDLDALPENILPAHKGAIECVRKEIHYSEYT